MLSNVWFLVAAALLPAVILAIYIFKKDRVEKEPFGLLLKLLLFGVISVIPVLFVGELVTELINEMFSVNGALDEYGITDLSGNKYYLYHIAKWFIGVALIEEGSKLCFLVLGTRKNKNFDHLFDGVIYAVFVSLGFAGFENIFYVLDYGFGNAVMRGIVAVPGHAFYGVMMGCYYSFWHISELAGEMENTLKDYGVISKNIAGISSTKFKVLSLVVPTLAHGLYDFCCSVGDTWAIMLFYGFVIFMYVYCFKKIKAFSAADGTDYTYATILLAKKYPQLTNELKAFFGSDSDETRGVENELQ